MHHAKGMIALTESISDEIISTSSTLHAEMEFLGLDGELAQSAAQSAQRTKALVAGMQDKESTASSSSSLGMEAAAPHHTSSIGRPPVWPTQLVPPSMPS